MTDLTPEARRAKYRENQDYFSGKISELSRYIGFGLVAVAFGLLSSDSVFGKALAAKANVTLSWAGLLGCATILADYLHLLMGWYSNSQAANNAKGKFKLAGIGKVFRFFQDWVFFYLKQILPVAGTILLLIAVSKSVTIPLLGTSLPQASPSASPTTPSIQPSPSVAMPTNSESSPVGQHR